MSFDKILAGWRASAGHDATLLMPDATRFGIALAKNPNAGYGVYWAMEVAAEPRTGPQLAVLVRTVPCPGHPAPLKVTEIRPRLIVLQGSYFTRRPRST